MDAPLGLLVVGVLVAAVAAGLRRWRTSLGRKSWGLVEVLPVLFTWTASWGAMWLFAFLAPFSTKAPFAGFALASACVPTVVVAMSPARYRSRAAAAVLLGLTILLFADALYFRFFGGLLPFLAMSSAGHIWDVWDSIVDLTQPRDLWLLVLVVPALAFLLFWPLAPTSRRPPWLFSLASGVVLTAACVAGAAPIKADVDHWLGTSRSWKVINILGDLMNNGVVVTHARDMASAWREATSAKVISAEERARVESYAADHRDRTLRATEHESFGALAGSNVVIVQMEAIQSWAVEADVDGEPVMPFLRGLKERGLYFSRVYDQTGGSPTSDCEYLTLNSLHPLSRGSVAFRRASNDFVTVPEVLREGGYSTLSAHAYHRGMWNRGVLHPRYGFDRSLFRGDIPYKDVLGWGMGDKPFFKIAVSEISQQPRPFFSFLITLTSHHPYNYVSDDDASLRTDGVPRVIARYLRSARYVDEAIAELFDHMEVEGLLESTTVVLYGDHDAKLKFGKKTAAAAAKKLNLDTDTLRRIGRRDWAVDRVPLFVVPPVGSRLLAAEIDTVGGQIDIGPTLLHYLGVQAPLSFLGAPLLPGIPGWAARYDGAAADKDRLAYPSRDRRPCRRALGDVSSDKLECGDLLTRADAQREVSALITIHDLSASLAAEPNHGE